MKRLRNRLIVLFLAATLAPLALTLWFATSLLERSLNYSAIRELDEISRSLETVGREFYHLSCKALLEDAKAGRVPPRIYAESERGRWPPEVQAFWESQEPERFFLSGVEGNQVNYLVRHGNEVRAWSRPLGQFGMAPLSSQYRRARALVESASTRDLRRGFTYTFFLLTLITWIGSFVALALMAGRISRPIQDLTAGLTRLASGDLSVRVETDRDDEAGHAIHAFNDMAEQLEQSRKRLVYLTQLASWQILARKMAHELKNSLTPIRLTMEELQARSAGSDQVFLRQASQIVVSEVESLERRVRAFSEFAAEPPVQITSVDVNTLLEERVALLRRGRPEVDYELRLDPALPPASADADLVKGVFTNLLENAAEAAGVGGKVLAVTSAAGGRIAVEIHDSGPGLNEEARQSLFEPTISFKKNGMGLGLSIARKSALLSGGDILLVKGELGGAAFRVLLSRDAEEQNSDRR